MKSVNKFDWLVAICSLLYMLFALIYFLQTIDSINSNISNFIDVKIGDEIYKIDENKVNFFISLFPYTISIIYLAVSLNNIFNFYKKDEDEEFFEKELVFSLYKHSSESTKNVILLMLLEEDNNKPIKNKIEKIKGD